MTNITMEENGNTITEKESPPSPSLEDNNPSSSTSKENAVPNGEIRCTPISALLANPIHAPKRKKKVITLNQKLQIIKRLDEGARAKELATEYNLGVSTVCKIYKKRDTINPVTVKWDTDDTTVQRKADRASKFLDLDKVMHDWLKEVREAKKPLKYSHILARAKHLYREMTGSMEGFSSSKGWWRLFRRQNGLHKGATLDSAVTECSYNKTEVNEKPFPIESDTKSSQVGDNFVPTKMDGEIAQIKYTAAVDCIKTVISYLKQDANTPYSLIQDAQSIYEHIVSQCKLKKQKMEGDVVANGCKWPSPDVEVSSSPSQKSNTIDTDSPALRPRQRKRRISADRSLTSWSCTISAPPSNSIRLRLKGPVEDEGMDMGKHQCSECEATFDEASQLEFHILTHFTKQESVPRVNRNARKGDVRVNFNGRRKAQNNRYNGAVFKNSLPPVTRLSVSGVYKAKDTESDSEEECQDFCHPTLPKKRRHRCSYCAKIFPKSAHLASHLRTHANKVFSCDECGIAFTQMQDLKKHYEEVHAILDSPGEKPFKCTLCDRLFKKKCHLIWHIQNHSFSSPVKVETPFKCDSCDRAFKLKCNLTWHQRTHREVVEEKVKVCEFPSPVPDGVTDNSDMDMNDFPYRCQVCKRTFRKNCNLKMHEKTHSHSNLSADVHVKCEDSDSLCDDTVDDFMDLESTHSDVSDYLAKDCSGQKNEIADSLASDIEHRLSKEKLNTSGKDDMVNHTEIHGIGKVNRPNHARRHNAEVCEKSLNFRSRPRHSTIKDESTDSLITAVGELLNLTDKPNTVKDDSVKPTNIVKNDYAKPTNTIKDDSVKPTDPVRNDSVNRTDTDIDDSVRPADTVKEDFVKPADTVKNYSVKPTGTVNIVSANPNDTVNDDSLNPTDTQDLTKDDQNMTKDTLKLAEDTQTLTKDTQNLAEDTQNLMKDTQNLTKDIQNLTKDTQSLTRDTQNFTTDTQNLTKGTQNLTTGTQNLTEGTQNLTVDDNVKLTDSLDTKNTMIDESSNSTKTEDPEMDESLDSDLALPFKCKFCPRTFKKNCNLKWHEKCHSKKRMKRSSYWDDSCSEGDDLDDLELQSDLLPYKCDECDRAFKMNCHLKRHQKTHIQESDEEPEIIEEDEIEYIGRGISRRNVNRRSVSRRSANRHNVNKLIINQGDSNKTNLNKPEMNKPKMNTTDMNTPNLNTPNMNTTEANNPHIDKHNMNGPNINRPDVNRPDVIRPNMNIPRVNRLDVNRPNVDRLNVNRSDVYMPDINRSYVNVPCLNTPDVDRTNINRLNKNAQSVNTPSINRIDMNAPNVNIPSVKTPSINRPDMNTPNINIPSVITSSINRPDINRPDMNRPDINRPNMNKHDTVRPNINIPDINRPSIDRPDINRPDINRSSVNNSSINRLSLSRDDQQNSFMHIDEGESSCLSPEDIESLIKKEIEDNIEEYDAYIDSIVKVEHDVSFDVMIKEEPDDTFELECY